MATVPFEFSCDREYGFLADPNVHKRLGYLVGLEGLGLAKALAADLRAITPFDASFVPGYKTLAYSAPRANAPSGTAKVVGVIANFSWAGGVGDPIEIDFYVSQDNALRIKALQQTALKTTAVKSLAWWMADYDQEAKKWFEQAYPVAATGAVSGVLAGRENPRLNVDLTPVPVKDGIDVKVYKVSIAVAPAANLTQSLCFANSAQKKQLKSWGLVVGPHATGAASASE